MCTAVALPMVQYRVIPALAEQREGEKSLYKISPLLASERSGIALAGNGNLYYDGFLV